MGRNALVPRAEEHVSTPRSACSLPLPRVLMVCGARPNFIKIAPIVQALRAAGAPAKLVHTGQHYDGRMSDCFFDELHIPRPDINLGVGGGSHAVQTAEVMRRFEPVCLQARPDWIVVVGDVNSTMACALVAAKLGIPVAHVEAGLRSFDRAMPEEINRVVTDSVSDLLLVSEPSGVENLRREGVPEGRIRFVGNVMIDTLLSHRAAAERSTVRQRLGLDAGRYATLTLHRPANVDDPDALGSILGAVQAIASRLPVVFPLHPRTAANIERFGLSGDLSNGSRLICSEPLGYLDFLCLMSSSAAVLTDSGGIQEETTILGVPCLTLRNNTERPITLTQGTNRLAGTRTDSILAAWRELRANPPRTSKMPELWDGRAAERVVGELLSPLLAGPILAAPRATAEVSAAGVGTLPSPGVVGQKRESSAKAAAALPAGVES